MVLASCGMVCCINMAERFLTTSKFAKELGITRFGVYRKIRRGEIKAKKAGRDLLIDRKLLPIKLSVRKNNKIRWLFIAK